MRALCANQHRPTKRDLGFFAPHSTYCIKRLKSTMPLRPFPFLFRVGTDICHVPRIREAITRQNKASPQRPLRQFLKTLLTEHEQQYFWKRFGSEAPFTNVDGVSQFLAGRFAAKEAIRKACTHLNYSSRGFQRIMVLPVTVSHHDEYRMVRPQGLVLDEDYAAHVAGSEDRVVGVEKAQERPLVDVDELDGQLCEISISHDGDYATAVAIVAGRDVD
ncbi:Holo-[acyl carrier ] synthase [Pyrenophora seminiperda CCB06]|uniref:Holo-[acyl carrier ] synthase n=1 Tax=Pyrenophora seminiperda CCB06 TaxID=1302712 RepID=A0A3M7MFU2_9PLEO|nr:Holo-[acyl carrier ] synthase [Pyrenophora seminiperda CCB06]